jgi:transposase
MKITRVGLDIAKLVFQVHGVDERGKVGVRKQLQRSKVLQFFAQLPPCVVGIEACGSSHYWGRELTKLGHTVKLMGAQFVIPYRKRSKNDANDAEAICEAVGRPNMRFVAVKSEEQQSVLMVHRARTLVVANRTAQVNQIRGLLGEFGLVVPKSVARLRRELPGILEDAENGLPALAREVLAGLLDQFRHFDTRVTAYDRQIRVLAAASEPVQRLMEIEAIGPQTATALVASMGDPHVYSNGRCYAASIGITPRPPAARSKSSTCGRVKLLRLMRWDEGSLRTDCVLGNSLSGFLEPPAASVELEQVAVMHQPVEHGGDQHNVAEERGPVVDGPV